MLLHPVTNFEIQKHYHNKPKFNDVYLRFEPTRAAQMKDGTYAINVDGDNQYELIQWLYLWMLVIWHILNVFELITFQKKLETHMQQTHHNKCYIIYVYNSIIC